MDRAAPSPVLEPRAWAELLTLSADESGDRSFLDQERSSYISGPVTKREMP